MQKAQSPRNELAAALAACRHALIALGIASAIINILYLTGSFFMLEIYDRVLPSRSVPTLIGLVDPRHRSSRLSGRARPDPRPHPGAHRRVPRRGLSARVYERSRHACR